MQAANDGYPLNTKIAIKPLGDLLPEQQRKLVDKFWNGLGVWSRRHTPDKTFHAILVRETKGGEHFHVLMHVSSSANLVRLRYALTKRFPEPGVAHIQRAHQRVSYTSFGKIECTIGYITKERTPQAAWPKWQYRPGGPVLGKRYRITANLRASADIRYRDIHDSKVTTRFDGKVSVRRTTP